MTTMTVGVRMVGNVLGVNSTDLSFHHLAGNLLFMPALWVHFVAASEEFSLSLNVWSSALEGNLLPRTVKHPTIASLQGPDSYVLTCLLELLA